MLAFGINRIQEAFVQFAAVCVFTDRFSVGLQRGIYIEEQRTLLPYPDR